MGKSGNMEDFYADMVASKDKENVLTTKTTTI